MSKYTEEQLKSFFKDVTNYIEDELDKKLVLNTSAGPALAISFKSVDDCTGFVITVVNDIVREGTVIRINTEDCIDYARKDPAFVSGMADDALAHSIAFTGLVLALLELCVTPIDNLAARNAVLAEVLPLVTPSEPEEEKDVAQAIRSILLEMLKELDEGK